MGGQHWPVAVLKHQRRAAAGCARDEYAPTGETQLFEEMDSPMRLTLLTGPAVEPLDLDEVKTHLRLDGDDEDALLNSLITTSRLHIEAALGLALMTQTWRWQADCWPAGGVVELMTRPLQNVSEIRVSNADGSAEILAAADYIVADGGATARLAARNGWWPQPGQRIGGIAIDFTAGFGDAANDVPAPIRHALKLLVAHWYEVRNPVHIGSFATRVPDTVSELLMPYRVPRL